MPAKQAAKPDQIWIKRYGHTCPIKPGKIITIQGSGTKDGYNPTLYEDDRGAILAFRYEDRASNSANPVSYRPSIAFARPMQRGGWHLAKDLEPFSMMEDPFLFYVNAEGSRQVIFGGVWVRGMHGTIVPRTEFYRGNSLETLEHIPFAVIDNMKDVRLLQLPDGRLLICRRPWGDKYMRGRIALHVINSLDDLVDIDKVELPLLALLDSCGEELDWVGVNNMYMLTDAAGEICVGLLGHVALQDQEGNLHYAACTYRISLEDLLSKQVHKICPQIIATRGCFEEGPAKNATLHDIVFPGSLQHLDGDRYRLWAGLSDARIGCVEIDDPFRLRTA
ncbi:MAG TPA: DUF1861 family protein [Candidatus Saccharimonadia bacterium]|nr:DUF1861 family protein [Candidatus Saccharimonadia bacterium]